MISLIFLLFVYCIVGFDIDLNGDFTIPLKKDLDGDHLVYSKETHDVKTYSFDGIYDTYPVTDTPYTYGYGISNI